MKGIEMYINEPRHEPRVTDAETCLGDLAVALGRWIGSNSVVTEMQAGCFIYSAMKLAKAAGVEREQAIRPFDVFHDLAFEIWEEIEGEGNGKT